MVHTHTHLRKTKEVVHLFRCFTHTHTQLSHTQHCHTPSCAHNFVTHYLSNTTCHTQLFTYNLLIHRSSSTSFVYPSFPFPLELFVSAYGKKLTCGAIRSFNYYYYFQLSLKTFKNYSIKYPNSSKITPQCQSAQQSQHKPTTSHKVPTSQL